MSFSVHFISYAVCYASDLRGVSLPESRFSLYTLHDICSTAVHVVSVNSSGGKVLTSHFRAFDQVSPNYLCRIAYLIMVYVATINFLVITEMSPDPYLSLPIIHIVL